MFKKLFDKSFFYNILSLFSVFLGFVFIVLLGRKFGAGKETDIYFISVVIINYLGYFVQSVWEAFTPYYAEIKIKNVKKAYKLFSILLNYLVIVSLILIILYFLISFFKVSFLSQELKSFLNIFIFYLLFQNILFLNKTILNLEKYYASFYIVDIFVFLVNIITISFFVKNDLILIAYSTLIGTFLANLWQFYLIFKKMKMRYYLSFYMEEIKDIVKNSFKLKLGSFFIGIKDIVIASVLTSFGSGIYSLYSYANKFLGVILQIINAPIVNIFAAKSTHLIAKNQLKESLSLMRGVLGKTVILYILAVLATYYLIPFIIEILFSNKFTFENILVIQKIFFIMSFYYFCTVIYSPLGRILTILKKFNFLVLSDFVFSAVLLILVKSVSFNSIYTLLYFLIISHVFYTFILFIYFINLINSLKKSYAYI